VCDNTTIGGIRESTMKEFTKCMNTQPREGTYELVKQPIKKILEFKLEDGKGCFITGMPGTGKSTKTNELKLNLKPENYIVCTPTHKSALIVNGETIYNVFNINPHDHTYIKGTVEKLKKRGVEWIFIDEVSMINSHCWAVLRDIKKIYNFKFVLVGDFHQLDPVEEKIYNVALSDVFAELCDYQVLTLTKNWRAEKDPDFKKFIDDLIKVRDGFKINYNEYGHNECRKSIAWTNMTRKIINNRWMLKESQGKNFYCLNDKKVFVGLPIIANKTTSLGKTKDKTEIMAYNNEEFEITFIDGSKIEIKNDRITITMKHIDFKNFDLAYCITVHKSQGSTFDFEYTIYDYNFEHFHRKLLYTAMSRSTQRSNINFVKTNYNLHTGYIYKITNLKTDKIYIGSTKRNDINDRFEEHKKSTDNSPLHQDMQLHEDFKIEIVKRVLYIDVEELLIAETCAMIEQNSINNGYNVKYPISIDSLH
jgi:energy-coupling factor transporter ATP-binding protein EcfA2